MYTYLGGTVSRNLKPEPQILTSIYTYVYAYIYTYIYVCVYISMSIYLSMSVYIYIALAIKPISGPELEAICSRAHATRSPRWYESEWQCAMKETEVSFDLTGQL